MFSGYTSVWRDLEVVSCAGLKKKRRLLSCFGEIALEVPHFFCIHHVAVNGLGKEIPQLAWFQPGVNIIKLATDVSYL